jgi:hypothetical protein
MSQTDTRGSGPPGLRWCALCRTEYVAGVLECADCLVTLVDAPPLTPEEVGDDDGDQLAYELDDVDAAERLAIDRELAEKGVVHAWEGTTLVVAPWDEAEVDAVLEGEGFDEDAAGGPTFDLEGEGSDDDQLVYDIADWDAEQRAELAAQLEGASIAHAFDEHGDLVVFAADEDRVDEIVDAVEHPDQLDAVDDGAQALDAVEMIGSLFVAADRLKNDPTDSEGTIAAADAARTMASMPPPFGFDQPVWEELVERAQDLRRLLETETEVVDDDAVAEVATRLRAALRPYV